MQDSLILNSFLGQEDNDAPASSYALASSYNSNANDDHQHSYGNNAVKINSSTLTLQHKNCEELLYIPIHPKVNPQSDDTFRKKIASFETCTIKIKQVNSNSVLLIFSKKDWEKLA